MAVQNLPIQPGEDDLYDLECEGILRPGDTIVEVLSTEITLGGAIQNPERVTFSAPVPSGTRVQLHIFVAADTPDADYLVKAKVRTANGASKTAEGKLLVREIK